MSKFIIIIALLIFAANSYGTECKPLTSKTANTEDFVAALTLMISINGGPTLRNKSEDKSECFDVYYRQLRQIVKEAVDDKTKMESVEIAMVKNNTQKILLPMIQSAQNEKIIELIKKKK